MAWFLCDIVGTGVVTDSVSDPLRPAIAEYGGGWSTMANLDARGLCVVRCADQVAFDSDPRIRKLTKALVKSFVPDDGEADGEDSASLALKVVRRALLEQFLGADDFGDSGSLILADISVAKRQRIRDKLAARGIDISGLTTSTAVADALRRILPLVQARVETTSAALGGTFIDTFGGEVSNTNLESHTPTGGTGWTRIDGAAGDARVSSAGFLSGSSTGAFYKCDDQDSANQYLEYLVANGNNRNSLFVNRASDKDNFIGIKPQVNIELWKNVTGVETLLGVGIGGTNNGDVFRLESSGNSHEVYLDGGSEIGPVNDTFNNTVTGQGFVARNDSFNNIATSFEAGTLGVGSAYKPSWAQGVNILIGA